MFKQSLVLLIFLILPIPWVQGPAPQPRSETIAIPVLEWAYGGCLTGPYCDTGWYASPAVFDLDGDQKPEVIWGNYDLFVLNGEDGTVQWEASGNGRIWPGIALADLTGDGDMEIIVGRGGDSLTVYDHTGAVVWHRNPFGSGEIRTVAVADLDGDEQVEIIVGRASGGATRQVNVFTADGQVRPGWPARHENEDGYGWGMYNENIAIADMDDDGFLEIFAPTDTHYITALDRNGQQLEANNLYSHSDHNNNGRITWAEVGVHVDQAADLRGHADCGLEHRPNFANVAPAISDVDGNGIPELIVPGDVYDCSLGDPEGDLYYLPWIFNLDRTRWQGAGHDWTILPAPAPNSGPRSQDYAVIENIAVNTVIADLDGDGLAEILYPAYDGRLHAYSLDKTQPGNWPYTVPGNGIRFASEPIVVDLNNDGQAEVIFTSWPEKRDNFVGHLHILDYQGNLLHLLNLPAPALGADWNGSLGAPTVANIDTDAALELIIGSTHSGVVAYELPGSENARILWGTGRGNFGRTGTPPAAPIALNLAITPLIQAIAAGETAVFQLMLSGATTEPVNVMASIPAPLVGNVSATTVTLPATITLTLTAPQTLPSMPGKWYSIPITAQASDSIQMATAQLLVGGARLYLPSIRH